MTTYIPSHLLRKEAPVRRQKVFREYRRVPKAKKQGLQSDMVLQKALQSIVEGKKKHSHITLKKLSIMGYIKMQPVLTEKGRKRIA